MQLPKKKGMRFLMEAVPYLIVFLCALIAGVLMYHAMEIRPFGDRSIIALDMYWQYFPMYTENAHSTGLSNVFYNWDGGMGFNNWAQNAYYCLSVFFLLFKLVPVEKMTELMSWIAILKPACAAMTMLGFLRHRCGRFSPLLMGGGIAYGLSAYMMAFFSQAMWTDCVIYTPILLIALERLLDGKNPVFYTLMLAAVVISNFYISFAVCLFLVLYVLTLTVPQIWQKDGTGFRGVLMKWLRFAGYSMIAAGITAAVTIPVILTLGQTIASEMGAPERLEWYKNYFDVLAQLLPGAELVYAFDYANYAVGLLIFLTVPLYFLNRSIRPGERIAHGVLLVFLMLSLNCNYLDYLWHGLHFPNQLPGRWCFLLCLYLVMLGTIGAVRTEGLNVLRVCIGEAVGALLLVLICMAPGGTRQTELPAIYWLMIVLAGAALIGAVVFTGIKGDEKQTKRNRSIALVCMTVAAVLQMTDCMTNYIYTAQREDGGVETTGAVYYNKRIPEIRAEAAAYIPEKDTFYRMEDYPNLSFNPGMMGGYPGMTLYSSTMNGDLYRFLKAIGDWAYAKNVASIYQAGSAVQNSLFGVKYIISQTEDHYSGVNYVTGEKAKVYENPTALSLAYAVSDDALEYVTPEDVQALRNQQEFLNALTGEETAVFHEMEPDTFLNENCRVSETALWENTIYVRDDAANTVSFRYEFTCQEDGDVLLENNFRSCKLTVTSGSSTQEYDSPKTRFACLGSFHAGDKIVIETEIPSMKRGWCGLRLYRFDAQAWDALYQKLASHELNVTKFSPTRVDGTIRLDSESLVMATIPQDGGWRLYCDGKKVETTEVADLLLAARIPAGEHTLSYRYRVPGLLPGGLISIAALLILVWFGFPSLRKAA